MLLTPGWHSKTAARAGGSGTLTATDPEPRAMVSLVELSHDVVGELVVHARQRGVTLVLDAADPQQLGKVFGLVDRARADQ